jgi:hypothetical protein
MYYTVIHPLDVSLNTPPDAVSTFNRRAGKYTGDEARNMLRLLFHGGGAARITGRARSPHGSDCDCSPDHATRTMGECRCVRVFRLRALHSGDWLLYFGDMAEGGSITLQGPYHYDTALSFGGGFWSRVTL